MQQKFTIFFQIFFCSIHFPSPPPFSILNFQLASCLSFLIAWQQASSYSPSVQNKPKLKSRSSRLSFLRKKVEPEHPPDDITNWSKVLAVSTKLVLSLHGLGDWEVWLDQNSTRFYRHRYSGQCTWTRPEIPHSNLRKFHASFRSFRQSFSGSFGNAESGNFEKYVMPDLENISEVHEVDEENSSHKEESISDKESAHHKKSVQEDSAKGILDVKPQGHQIADSVFPGSHVGGSPLDPGLENIGRDRSHSAEDTHPHDHNRSRSLSEGNYPPSQQAKVKRGLNPVLAAKSPLTVIRREDESKSDTHGLDVTTDPTDPLASTISLGQGAYLNKMTELKQNGILRTNSSPKITQTSTHHFRSHGQTHHKHSRVKKSKDSKPQEIVAERKQRRDKVLGNSNMKRHFSIRRDR